MYEIHRVCRFSINFRVLDDDGDGVNSNSIIDNPNLCFKFNVEEHRTLAFLFTAPRLMTPQIQVHRKFLHGFTIQSFELFFYENISSCVRDLLSSVQLSNRELLQEEMVNATCEKMKELLSTKDPKTMDIITVAFKFHVIQVMDLNLELNEDEDETEEISDFIRMKPTSSDAIQALEKKKLVIEEGDLSQTCGVCLDEFQNVVEVKMMPCSHIFHEDCIVQWLGRSNKCPLCRFEMPV